MRRYWLRVVFLGVSSLSLLAAVVALSACGGSSPSGELCTSADDVVGVWRRTREWEASGIAMRVRTAHMKLTADGSMGFGMSPDKWDYEFCSEEFAFEGTQFKVTETTCPGWLKDWGDFACTAHSAAPSGVYEVHLLANGNLKFVDAGDDCQLRRDLLTMAEWEPVF